MMPAPFITGPGVVLVKHVQVQEPLPVQQFAPRVNVGVHAVFSLHHGKPVPEISCVAVAFLIGGRTLRRNVEVAAVWEAHRAAFPLEVAAPSIEFRVHGTTVGQDVEPPVGGVYCGQTLIKPEGAQVPGLVGRYPVRSDVIASRCIPHRGQTRTVELEDLIVSAVVEGTPVIPQMVAALRRGPTSLPVVAPAVEVVVRAGQIVTNCPGYVGNPVG